MCGIAGLVRTRDGVSTDPGVLSRMLASLQHRGPDSGGEWQDAQQRVQLGHRRLAILDLSPAGHQPMHSASGRFTITFNGEIYNFLKIKADLEAAGHVFASTSDTEVILEGCEEWGVESTIRRLAGMFSLAIWDNTESLLHCIVDRVGKKPLIVAPTRDGFAFASEVRALAAAGLCRSVDSNGAAHLVQYGYIPHPLTIWREARKLPPGTITTFRLGDVKLPDSVPYWRLNPVIAAARSQPIADLEEATNRLDEVLRVAVAQRMVADVPLGAFLSGGIDSSTVVALMQHQSDHPVRTFTIGFTEASYDEADSARSIAEFLGTEHTEHLFTPDQMIETLLEIPRILDEPLAAPSQLPIYLLSKAARRDVTVVLTGDGGDEVFGGYNRHIQAARFAQIGRLPRPVKRTGSFLLSKISRMGGYQLDQGTNALTKRKSKALASVRMQKLEAVLASDNEADQYQALASPWPSKEVPTMQGAAAPDYVMSHWPSDFTGAPSERMMVQDTLSYLPGEILAKVDRATMAVSLESRAPFLDHRVIEFAWRLPVRFKVTGGRGKFIVRRLLERYLPSELVNRPKSGFTVPIGEWMNGPLRGWCSEMLSEGRIARSGMFDPATVTKAWRHHQAGIRDNSLSLWPVLMYEAWSESGKPLGFREEK